MYELEQQCSTCSLRSGSQGEDIDSAVSNPSKHDLLVGGDYGVIPSQRRTSRRPCERTKRSVLQRGLSMVKSEGDNEG